MAEGWVKVYRELMDKPIWLKSTPGQKSVLITVLMLANHQANSWEWNGHKYVVSPGQFISSPQKIAERAGKGITRQIVRGALARFANLQFLTMKATKDSTLVTIVNWAIYQGDQDNTTNHSTNVQPTYNQPTTTNKNEKNDKEKTVPTPTGAVPALSFYEQNFGVMPPVLQQDISDWVGDFEEIGSTNDQANQILVKAMQIALERNNRSFGYVKGILRDWEGKKLTTVAAVEGEEAKFKQLKQANKRGSGRRNPEPPPTGYEFTDDDLPF